MITEFYVAEKIVLRQEVEIFFRQSFVAELIEVSSVEKNFFKVVGRVEGVGQVKDRKIIRMKDYLMNLIK